MAWWRRLSIAAKLPLGIGTLLLIVLCGMTAAVYVAARQDAFELASERLNRAALQFSVGLAQQSDQRLAELDRLSRSQLVRRFVATEDAGLAAAVADTLRGLIAPAGAERIELWSADGRLLQTSAAAAAPPVMAEAPAPVGDAPDGPRAGVSPMERTGDRLSYTVAEPVRIDGATDALLVERHVLENSPQQAAAVTELIGSGARMLVGSPATGAWTDLAGPVDPPPLPAGTRGEIVDYGRPGGHAVLARVAEVPGAPWVLVMELDRGAVLEPARSFLGRTLLLSVLLSVAGAGAAWLMSRRISGPLRDVTRAAEALAAGRAAPPLAVRRADEVGRLGRAFNIMTGKVLEARHELEDRVAERTAALEAANRELEAFSYSVSHDLRAPLRAVDGFAAVLVEDHEDELSADARRCVRLIRTSAQQMGHLIDDLLAFSRLGRQSLHRTTVDMDALVRSVVAEACASAGRDPAEFTIDLLPPAFGEPSMLKQAVTNYVSNAIKFTRDARPPHVRISGQPDGGEVVYAVRDNGLGFDMRYVDKLFGVFQRLHATEEYEGTGVGLAIVKRVVERHGGRVWAEGEPGRGATFHFTLPLADGSEPPDIEKNRS